MIPINVATVANEVDAFFEPPFRSGNLRRILQMVQHLPPAREHAKIISTEFSTIFRARTVRPKNTKKFRGFGNLEDRLPAFNFGLGHPRMVGYSRNREGLCPSIFLDHEDEACSRDTGALFHAGYHFAKTIRHYASNSSWR